MKTGLGKFLVLTCCLIIQGCGERATELAEQERLATVREAKAKKYEISPDVSSMSIKLGETLSLDFDLIKRNNKNAKHARFECMVSFPNTTTLVDCGGLPETASFSNDSGKLGWTPVDTSPVGRYNFTITAFKNRGHHEPVDSASISVDVYRNVQGLTYWAVPGVCVNDVISLCGHVQNGYGRKWSCLMNRIDQIDPLCREHMEIYKYENPNFHPLDEYAPNPQ